MASDFEKKYFRESRYWVNLIEINALDLTLDIQLVANPERQEVLGRLRFEQVTNYVGNYHEYEGEFYGSKFERDYLPSLWGIFSEETSNGTKYIITTDIVEIILVTKKEPEIFWIE